MTEEIEVGRSKILRERHRWVMQETGEQVEIESWKATYKTKPQAKKLVEDVEEREGIEDFGEREKKTEQDVRRTLDAAVRFFQRKVPTTAVKLEETSEFVVELISRLEESWLIDDVSSLTSLESLLTVGTDLDDSLLSFYWTEVRKDLKAIVERF